ncbi:MAG: hypothetical protein PHY48_15825 [Candidatus Cloacimonetes bacterium]|nr:hypothetical protein [Candidatus Cloacimonadota bacterium]
MIKRKFSTTLLALVVAAALPGSAFAAEVATESTGEVSAPSSVSAPASSSSEADNSGSADADANGSTESGSTGEAQGTTGGESVTGGQESSGSDQRIDSSETKGEADGKQTPSTTERESQGEGDKVATPDTETPAVSTPEQATEPIEPAEGTETAGKPENGTGQEEGEQPTTPQAPVTEGQPAEPVIAPETPVIEPEVIPEVVTEGAIVTTEAAIVVPQESTLLILHLFESGDIVCEDYETVNGLTEGKTIRIGEYNYEDQHEFTECLNEDETVDLVAGENQITLRYTLKEGYTIAKKEGR